MIDYRIYNLAQENTINIYAIESFIEDALYELNIEAVLESIGTQDHITELANNANVLKERAKIAKSEAEKQKIIDEYRKINDEIGRLQKTEKSEERKKKLLKAAKIVGACAVAALAAFGLYKGGKALSKKFNTKAKLKAESDPRIQAINKQIDEDKAATDNYIKEVRESTEKAIETAEQTLKEVYDIIDKVKASNPGAPYKVKESKPGASYDIDELIGIVSTDGPDSRRVSEWMNNAMGNRNNHLVFH